MFESVALEPADRDPILHSGGLAVPMLADKPRLNKPPLIYWLQATSAAIFSGGDPTNDAIWMYRVPSAVAGIGIVLLTWWIGTQMFDPRAGWLAGAMIAVSPAFVWEAHQARADMVLILFTTLAMGALARIYSTRHADRSPGWAPIVLWGAIAFGMLTKGPITPMVIGLASITLSLLNRSPRWLGRTRPLLGIGILLLVVAPWVVVVAQHVGWNRLIETVDREVLQRSAGAMEGHWGPPGYHLIFLLVLFWPGALLTAASFARAWTRGTPAPPALRTVTPAWKRVLRRAAGRDAEAFCLAWVIPSWIVFELVGTKLPHYTMPLYPAIALLSARGVLGVASVPATWRTVAPFALWLTIGAAALLGTLVGALLLAGATEPFSPTRFGGAALVLIGLCVIGNDLLRGRLLGAQLKAIAVGAIWAASISLTLRTPSAPQWTTVRVSDAIDAADPAGTRPIADRSYHEDSLRFTTRARARRLHTDPGAWLDEHPDGLLVIDASALDEGLGSRVTVLQAIEGFNYSRGEPESLLLVERTDD